MISEILPHTWPLDSLALAPGQVRRTLFLIDGSSQMYRAYHAFRGGGLSNQEGQDDTRGLSSS